MFYVTGKGEGARKHLQGWKIFQEFAMMVWTIIGLAFIIMVFNIITESVTESVNKLNPKQKAKVEQTITEMLEELEDKSSSIEASEDREKLAHEFAERIACDIEALPTSSPEETPSMRHTSVV